MKVSDQIGTPTARTYHKLKMRLLNSKEGTRQSIIKSISSNSKLKLNKLHQLKNISNIKKRIKPYYNTVENYKKEKNKWMKEEKKLKIVSIKYPNYITVSKSPKLKDNIVKINMSLQSLKEIFQEHNSSEEMMSQHSCMKKSKSNNQHLLRVRLPLDKDWLILNYSSTKNKISKDNSKY